MSTLNRQLVALDILSQDMADELNAPEVKTNQHVSDQYIRLLKQYLKASHLLSRLAEELTENGFSDAISGQGICSHLVNKKMLLVQNRLLEYVVDYYTAMGKLDRIREVDFSEQAEIRFTLLTTKAIKLKSQFRTVAIAMTEEDYRTLMDGTCLPEFDWGWNALVAPSSC